MQINHAKVVGCRMEQKELLNIVTDNAEYIGAYNIRVNGKLLERSTNEFVDIVSKKDKDGIDIIVKDNTVNQTILIPVILTKGEITDKVYNDFYIGKNCDVKIIAGCGVDNCSSCTSQHDGIHSFYVGQNSKVKYIERHYGHGDGSGKKVLNPITNITLGENSTMEIATVQIEGVDESLRITNATLNDNSSLAINEKILTAKNQIAKSEFNVFLNGTDSKAKVSSRVVAKDDSCQYFNSNVEGNSVCFAHVECDAIIVGNAKVSSVPKIVANNPNASLVHEATIGKIAGEQFLKLLTLGLSESEAEKEILEGFLK